MNEPKNNLILAALSSQEYQRLIDNLEPVSIALHEILIEAGSEIESLYFPTQGIVSLVSTMKDGSTTEVGLIGKEGMVGISQFLGGGVTYNRAVVQIQGTAMRIDAQMLRVEFERDSSLQKNLSGYGLKLFNQVSQCSACNNHHSVEQRTARWLLMLDDRVDDETFVMTQQLLSQMLGVRRTGVSEIASAIQQQGIIDYSRGRMRILNRKALEAIACECYQIIKS
ncbi:Crp/Fnr family transcriptional regulator [Pleurocapsales cyanobacterium LEGE 10410]|nr:Crp/Fnr family transcriptional regulator [Pleurocapsales cyanobacterium LEGE 10410]